MFRSASRVLAAAVSSACIVMPAPSLGLTITINGGSCTSSVDSANNVTVNCSGGTTNPSCTVSAQPTSLPASGGTVTVSSNCGATVTWTKNSSAAGSGTSWQDSIPANASTSPVNWTYTVTGSAGSASVTVPQAGTGSTPPPPPSGISCTNIPGITSTTVIPVSWNYTAGLTSTKSFGGFAPGQAVVFVFTVPAGVQSASLGNFSTSPTDQNAYNNRTIALSDTPCDLSGKLAPSSIKVGQEPNIYFSVGVYPTITKFSYSYPDKSNPMLNAGQTYYLTVVQQDSPGNNTCNSSACNINFGLAKPSGT
jgi:hypothetical protein